MKMPNFAQIVLKFVGRAGKQGRGRTQGGNRGRNSRQQNRGRELSEGEQKGNRKRVNIREN
jgi:hypothetical protein